MGVSRIGKNEHLREEGDEQQVILVIQEGRVRIERSNGGSIARITTLGPNEVAGEMSFVQAKSASASVVAETDVTAVVIQAPDVYALLASDPGFATRFYLCLARTLAARLESTTAGLIDSAASANAR